MPNFGIAWGGGKAMAVSSELVLVVLILVLAIAFLATELMSVSCWLQMSLPTRQCRLIHSKVSTAIFDLKPNPFK